MSFKNWILLASILFLSACASKTMVESVYLNRLLLWPKAK